MYEKVSRTSVLGYLFLDQGFARVVCRLLQVRVVPFVGTVHKADQQRRCLVGFAGLALLLVGWNVQGGFALGVLLA